MTFKNIFNKKRLIKTQPRFLEKKKKNEGKNKETLTRLSNEYD